MTFLQRKSVCHANHKRRKKNLREPGQSTNRHGAKSGGPGVKADHYQRSSISQDARQQIHKCIAIACPEAGNPCSGSAESPVWPEFWAWLALCPNFASLLTTFNGVISNTRLAGNTVCTPAKECCCTSLGAIKRERKGMVDLKFLFDCGTPFAGPESKRS